MKTSRRLLLLASLAAGTAPLLPPPAAATEFALSKREPGPGHRLPAYWWNFNGAFWELTPPEGFSLTGGGELRIGPTDAPGSAVVCRAATGREAALLAAGDAKAQAEYVRGLLPPGITKVKLDGEGKNSLPVNGLSNVYASYTYELGGESYRYTLMISQGGEANEQSPPVPGRPTPAPTATPKPGPDGKPVHTGELFTTVAATAQSRYDAVFGAFQQLMAGAKVLPKQVDKDATIQYASHGMLGR